MECKQMSHDFHYNLVLKSNLEILIKKQRICIYRYKMIFQFPGLDKMLVQIEISLLNKHLYKYFKNPQNKVHAVSFKIQIK